MQGFEVPSGTIPQPAARRYIEERMRSAMFATAGVSYRLSWNSATRARESAAIGALPRAGRTWRLITER